MFQVMRGSESWDDRAVLAVFADERDAQAYAVWHNLTHALDENDPDAARVADPVPAHEPGEWQPSWPEPIQALIERQIIEALDMANRFAAALFCERPPEGDWQPSGFEALAPTFLIGPGRALCRRGQAHSSTSKG
jgi:hypothetical protein